MQHRKQYAVDWNPPPEPISDPRLLGDYTREMSAALRRTQELIQGVLTSWGSHDNQCFFHRRFSGYNKSVALGVTTYTITFDPQGGTDYGVMAIPSWLTTVSYSGKAAGQVVLNFRTAAPAGATIDFMVWRAISST